MFDRCSDELLVVIVTRGKASLEWFAEICEEVTGKEWLFVLVFVLFVEGHLCLLEVKLGGVLDDLVEGDFTSLDGLGDGETVIHN